MAFRARKSITTRDMNEKTDHTEQRIQEIGRRANALRQGGFYSVDEVKWLAGFVRQPGTLLVEIEYLLTNAERIVKNEAD